MFNNDNKFVYKVDNSVNHIFDEKGNTFLALRKVAWGEGSEDYKLDLRKWYTSSDGSEKLGKGFSFLTEDGPGELARILLSNGYCDTEQAIEAIKDREDFKSSLIKVLGNSGTEDLGIEINESEKTSYYDPKEVLL